MPSWHLLTMVAIFDLQIEAQRSTKKRRRRSVFQELPQASFPTNADTSSHGHWHKRAKVQVAGLNCAPWHGPAAGASPPQRRSCAHVYSCCVHVPWCVVILLPFMALEIADELVARSAAARLGYPYPYNYLPSSSSRSSSISSSSNGSKQPPLSTGKYILTASPWRHRCC